MFREYPESGTPEKHVSRARSVTLREALTLPPIATTDADAIAECRTARNASPIHGPNSAPALTLQLPNVGIERRLTLREAITQLEPTAEYTLEEALYSLYEDKDQERSFDDNEVDFTLDSVPRVSKRLSIRSSEIVNKEVADFLEQAYSPSRTPSLCM